VNDVGMREDSSGINRTLRSVEDAKSVQWNCTSKYGYAANAERRIAHSALGAPGTVADTTGLTRGIYRALNAVPWSTGGVAPWKTAVNPMVHSRRSAYTGLKQEIERAKSACFGEVPRTKY
jgi:hypothetical protein